MQYKDCNECNIMIGMKWNIMIGMKWNDSNAHKCNFTVWTKKKR